MSYFADSFWEYIAKKIGRLQKDRTGTGRLLVIVPAFEEAQTLELAEVLQNRCLADSSLVLTFKISTGSTKAWSAEGRSKMVSFGWADDIGDLTYYRNLPPIPEKTNLVVLCGADRISDSGSLADFHHCGLETVWTEEMKSSFQSWVYLKLKSIGKENAEAADFKTFDRLLKPLIDLGKANLLTLGNWLESLDLSSADSARDVMKIMLGRFDRFNLPKFTTFPFERKRATLSPYIEKAGNFFSYAVFLESREREKAVKAIEELIDSLNEGKDIGMDLDEQDIIGPYANVRDFLEGLKSYIQTENLEDRDRLKKCDFVTIMDKILKFKKERDEPEQTKETLHKLSGGPVEVILHAIWQTLREFGRSRVDSEDQIRGILILPDRFKHDYDNADEAEEIDATMDRTELARRYLQRLLGGVDKLINQHVELPGKEGENLKVESTLASDEIPCVYAKTAEPQLEFSIKLTFGNGTKAYSRKFAWRLPEIHSYRLAESLLHWATDALAAETSIWKLPVFHFTYYEELLRATDDEETRRVMLHCVRDTRPDDLKMTNLLERDWLISNDILLNPLKNLAEKYTLFIKDANSNGLHKALFGEKWVSLRQAHAAVRQIVVQNPRGIESQMTAMLFRAFLFVQQRPAQLGTTWVTEPFERSGISTILHPATLEMLEAHVLFLFSCFNAAAIKELQLEDKRKAFAENVWSGYVDLASIHSPIVGLLYNADLNLSTNIRGEDLIHCVGYPQDQEATLSTRLLVRYDNIIDDEEMADAEMFRESRESKLLFRLMTDYFRLHPHARDGLKLAVFRNQDIQPIIAAVHQYLNKLADESDRRYYVLSPERRKPYAIGVTIFTESGDDVAVARWIEQWQERWEAAETENKFQAYRNCRFSVSHRIVEASQLSSFQRLIKDSFEADIAIFYDFIGAGQSGNQFAEVEPFDITTRTLKFPILEKSFCAVHHPIDKFKRSRVISNRQFALGTFHAEVMYRLKYQGAPAGKEFIVLGVGDFTPWREVINAVHTKAEWVICIDPNIDERLIKIPAGIGDQEREIIGFGSGVGSHGEANFTISTEQFSLADVQLRLAASIQEVYATWSSKDCNYAATGILHEARELSGLSLVRATGVGHYIRDFMAYALTRKMLRVKNDALCDHLITLDAYRHWFDQTDDERRPDLMWLTAWLNNDNRMCLKIHLIECKVAAKSDVHLRKAQAQIKNGLDTLIPAFARNPDEGPLREDLRPDQRYWWLQLHRLITSKAKIENSQVKSVLSAMERLANGDFEIEWGASVFAFWSDDGSNEVKRIGTWKPNKERELTADIYSIGSNFVRNLASGGTVPSVSWAEWQERSSKTESNICENLEDIEVPPDEEDSDDIPLWDEGEEREENKEERLEIDYSERLDSEPTPVEVVKTETTLTPSAPAGESISQDLADESKSAGAPGEEKEDQVAPVVPAVPDRILLGKTIQGANPVYWEFGHEQLANRHMMIFGTSGMGKTYAIQCFLNELARSGQNSLILDYTDGFVSSKLEKETVTCLHPLQHFIQQKPLPINPFKSQVSIEDGITFCDNPLTIAKRVAAIFTSVYNLGNQQFPVLIDAITEGIQKYGEDFTMVKLLETLHSYIRDEDHSAGTVRTTISKLKPFIQGNPFAEDKNGVGWLELFSDIENRCHVFQFFKVDRHSARALIEFVLWDLYSFVSSTGNRQLPRIIVLDEVQNLDLGPDAPVAKYLTEGRKHGLALITATQTVKQVGGVNDARVSRFFQAGQKLFFKPTENELREHAQLLHNAISSVSVQDWVTRLSSLQKGECYSLGFNLNESNGRLELSAKRIRITSLEERRFNA